MMDGSKKSKFIVYNKNIVLLMEKDTKLQLFFILECSNTIHIDTSNTIFYTIYYICIIYIILYFIL